MNLCRGLGLLTRRQHWSTVASAGHHAVAHSKAKLCPTPRSKVWIVPNCSFYWMTDHVGMDSFRREQKKMEKLVQPVRKEFVKCLEKHLMNDSLIYSKDLQTLIYIANTDKELSLLLDMVYKYIHQPEKSYFIFGPDLIRRCILLERLDLAYELFMDTELTELFCNARSPMLVMDYLLQNKQYNKVFEAFQRTLDPPLLHQDIFPSNISVMYFGACYEVNTPEICDEMIKYTELFRKKGFTLVDRATGFCVLLALKQDKPDVAMSLINNFGCVENYIPFNGKLLTLLKMGKVDTVMDMLLHDLPTFKRNKGAVFTDVMDGLRESISSQNQERSHLLSRVEKLKYRNYFSDFSSEEYIMLPPIRGDLYVAGSRKLLHAKRKAEEFKKAVKNKF